MHEKQDYTSKWNHSKLSQQWQISGHNDNSKYEFNVKLWNNNIRKMGESLLWKTFEYLPL